MNYIGLVNNEIIKQIQKIVGNRTHWDGAYSLYAKGIESQHILLQGKWSREDIFIKGDFHTMQPNFISISEEDFNKRLLDKRCEVLPDFTPAERWIELYKSEEKRKL